MVFAIVDKYPRRTVNNGEAKQQVVKARQTLITNMGIDTANNLPYLGDATSRLVRRAFGFETVEAVAAVVHIQSV